MSSQQTMHHMRAKRQNGTAERNNAKQKDTTTGEPHATLPPRWRKQPPDPAHHQHRREGAQSESSHGEQSRQSLKVAAGFGGKSINQRTRQEAVEHAESKRRGAVAGRQQAAQ